MAKSMYAYVRDAWKIPAKSGVRALLWERMQIWRREGSVVRVLHPTRIDRARSLGYKAKQGIVVVRVSVRRGGRRASRYVRARRTARMGVTKEPWKKYSADRRRASLQKIPEHGGFELILGRGRREAEVVRGHSY